MFQVLGAIECDMTGWRCLTKEGEFEPDLYEFLPEGKNSVSGEKMIEIAKEKGISSGLKHLEGMLRNQERIPVEWRKFVLVSTEVWQSPEGFRSVWCLCWVGDEWILGYRWTGDKFGTLCRIVSSRK